MHAAPKHRSPIGLALAFALACGSAAANDEKIRTVVVGLEGRRNVDEGLAMAMSDVVHGETLSDKSRVVFGRTDLQRVLEFESERQALGCQDDSCLAELASAMDADRIITGSIDKVGSSYFVVIAEIDAKKVEPLGRVQRTLPLDEDQLIVGIQAMTRELLRAHQSAALAKKPATSTTSGAAPVASAPVAAASVAASPSTDAPAPDAEASARTDDDEVADSELGTGTIEVHSTPEGLDLFRDGAPVGKTPYALTDVPAGTVALAVAVDGGTPLAFDVVVKAGETTVVEVEQSTLAPSPVARDDFESASSSHSSTTWGLLGGAAGCCAAGIVGGLVLDILVIAAIGTTGFFGYGTTLGCCCGSVACLGLGIGGLVNMFALAPTPPSELASAVHRATVRTPGEDAEVLERPVAESPPPAPAPVSLLY